MQPSERTMTIPTIFINVFRIRGALMPMEQAVITNRAEAIRDAEEFADEYRFTLTDTGSINLEPEFSEAWQEKKDRDAVIEARIDEMKEQEFAGEARGA